MGLETSVAGKGSGCEKQPNNASGQRPAQGRTKGVIGHVLLAIVGAIALIACVAITLEISGIQRRSMEWNKVWTNHVNQLVALRGVVANLGLASDKIEENDSPSNRKLFDAAWATLNSKVTAIRSELKQDTNALDPTMDVFVDARINEFMSAVEMIRDGNAAVGGAAAWPTRFAATSTDIQEKLANTAITKSTTYIRSRQISQAEVSVALVRSWILWQYIVGGITLPFMFALASLSVWASRRLQRSLEDRQRALSELNAYQVALDNHAIISITDAAGAFTHLNEEFLRISKYTREELVGQTTRILDSNFHSPEFWNDMWQTISAATIWHGEVCNRAKDGSLFWVKETVLPLLEKGRQPNSFISIATDITRQKALEDELRTAARTDKLTGLPNRAALSEHIDRAIASARRHPDCQFAVLFLDMDRFKMINDCLGHEAGDMLLCEIAKRLKSTLREENMLAVATQLREDEIPGERLGQAVRLGGDEFVVLLDGLKTANDALVVANRLLDKLAAPYPILRTEVHSTASIGIVTSSMENTSAADMLRDADTAMYEAKLAGKGRYVVFDQKMRQRVERRLNLETDLRRALEGGQFMLHYQPLIDLRTATIFSYEALLRWNHPQHGMISPAEFIPIAEESGLIIPIGEWVLRESCRQLAQWQKTTPAGAARIPGVSVNVSRGQLAVGDLPATVLNILNEFGLEPSSLHLEITEGTVMRDPVAARELLKSLREIGVKLALDDFGTGYSSLASVHEFPLDLIKIDRSFIANMSRGRDFAALVHAIISLARNLNILVVAEGIETAEQLVMLQSIDCQIGQGYLFAKPLKPEEVPGFSADQAREAVAKNVMSETNISSAA